MRIGIGYDVHRLVAERPLIVGGVNIPHRFGLLGHSDADVLCHAVMDALLGAAALPDIGQLFPDNDLQYAGADSLILLRRVGELLCREDWQVVNVDAVIMAERPKMAPHILQMRENIAGALGIEPAAVGLKATTTEKLGFVGREEGIAAQAVALLEKKA